MEIKEEKTHQFSKSIPDDDDEEDEDDDDDNDVVLLVLLVVVVWDRFAELMGLFFFDFHEL